MAVIMVMGAALLARSFVEVRRIPIGIDMDRLAVFSIRATDNRFPTPEARATFVARITETLEALPGVMHVTTASTEPMAFSISGRLPYLEGEPEPQTDGLDYVLSNSAPTNYFRTLGIPVVAGRPFGPSDSNGVVIVNEGFARSRGGDVLGRTLRIAGDTLRYTVVGVVGDVQSPLSVFQRGEQLYYPSISRTAYTRFVLRTEGAPDELIKTAIQRLGEVYPDIPLRETTTGAQLIRDQTSRVRFLTVLLAGFGVLGLMLAVSGVYGAVSLDVARRTREMGIRMAIGATASSVQGHVLSRGLRPVAVGALFGALAVVLLSPRIESLLFQVPSRDVWSVVAGLILLTVTAVFGCLIPARRASRIDPAGILRTDT